MIRDFNCKGSELTVLQCSYSEPPNECPDADDLAVKCGKYTCTHATVIYCVCLVNCMSLMTQLILNNSRLVESIKGHLQ